METRLPKTLLDESQVQGETQSDEASLRRRRWRVVRDAIAQALGGWKCVNCGNTDTDVLTFDHMNGRGEEERNRMGGQFPNTRYYFAHLAEARSNLQVLCANCNWLRNYPERYGRGGRALESTQRRMRQELIVLLGGPRCVRCGESD